MNIIPKIGSRGCYELSDPFDSLVDPNKIYTCSAIRSIQEMVYSQDRPLDTIYTPNGLTEELYNQHIKESVFIVTLTGDSGENIYVPNIYINNYPYINGVIYNNKAVVLNLGSLPVGEDIELLLGRLKDDVQSTIGIITEPEVVTTSGDFKIDYADDGSLTTIRDGYKTVNASYKTMYLDAVKTIEELGSHITLMECVLSNNCCGETCGGSSVYLTETEHIEECSSNNTSMRRMTAVMMYQQSGCFRTTHRNDLPSGGVPPQYIPPTNPIEYEFDTGMYYYSGTAELQYRSNT